MSTAISEAFRGVPDHTPATSWQNARRIVRTTAENGERIPTVKIVKIVGFRPIRLLENPSISRP